MRIFLLWEDFQKSGDKISRFSLLALGDVLKIAESLGLQVMPTLFCGHMSGVNWLPEWTLGTWRSGDRFPVYAGDRIVKASPRNLYSDPAMVEAEKLFVQSVVEQVRAHPALYGWDLGNEHSNLDIPASSEEVKTWNSVVCDWIRTIDPRHTVTNGIHTDDLEGRSPFRPQDMAEGNDYLCMHGYPQYVGWSGGPLDTSFVPFLCRFTETVGKKPVLFEEFGMPCGRPEICKKESTGTVKILGEEDAAAYYQAALEGLHRAGALGAFPWCFADYHRSLWELPPFTVAPHERFFGLLREDGTVKPHGKVFQQFAGQKRQIQSPGKLEVSREDYEKDPGATLRDMYRAARASAKLL
ncbi:MAG: hypothetical protein HYU64_04480 [Armatimonadetes bacterium]|nr:hypothetical protein [Armatimonadota bacterium]